MSDIDNSDSENKKKYERGPEIRFGVSQKMKDELFNLIENKGMDKPAFFRGEMRKILDAAPAHMKLPPRVD
jgi:hypothetical protein